MENKEVGAVKKSALVEIIEKNVKDGEPFLLMFCDGDGVGAVAGYIEGKENRYDTNGDLDYVFNYSEFVDQAMIENPSVNAIIKQAVAINEARMGHPEIGPVLLQD